MMKFDKPVTEMEDYLLGYKAYVDGYSWWDNPFAESEVKLIGSGNVISIVPRSNLSFPVRASLWLRGWAEKRVELMKGSGEEAEKKVARIKAIVEE